MIKKFLTLICLAALCAGCATQPHEDLAWVEQQIILNEIWNQKGILTIPKENKSDAVVVLLSGSGPNDADYTVEKAGLYQQLAHGLALHGISSFRMDKRSAVKNEEMKTIQEEILEDAQKALKMMKNRYQRVFVLGHSLSAIVLPALEADGMIFLSGSVSEVEEVYALQLLKNASEDEKKNILEELEMIQSLEEDTGFSWFGIKESWWLSLDELHLEERLASLTVPVLVMHGSEDDVIDKSELNNYQKILRKHEDAEYILLQGLDHYLRPIDSLQLDESVILKIASWILKST